MVNKSCLSIGLFVCLLLAFAIPVSLAASTQESGLACTDYVYAGESDAESLVILNNESRQGYWWDHADLTIAVQPHPNASQEQIDAIRYAIAIWSSILNDCLGGVVTLEDMTGQGLNPHQTADIVLHYVPGTGGVVFSGRAVCGSQKCPNVLLSTDTPPSLGYPETPPQLTVWLTLHEIGHALGLGHATNIYETNDIMGYSWFVNPIDPVLSQCSIDALRFIFAWAFEGSEPRPPAAGPFAC